MTGLVKVTSAILSVVMVIERSFNVPPVTSNKGLSRTFPVSVESLNVIGSNVTSPFWIENTAGSSFSTFFVTSLPSSFFIMTVSLNSVRTVSAA